MAEPGAPSEYVIQVVHIKSGAVVQWAPGLAVEQDFEGELCRRVRERGVGLARTTNHVVEDVKQAFRELMQSLKAKV